MAKMTGNHSSYYIERAVRKQKKEYILSLIKASYYAEKNASETRPLKTILIERLTYALALFRDDVTGYVNGIGGYSAEQFDKDYTVGHEMAIWKNSNLELNDYAKLVAEDKITVTDYFDRIFTNYFQPVNNIGVHPLYNILNYLKINNKKEIRKEEASQALGVPIEGQDVNGLFHYLGDTSYFIETRDALLYVSSLPIEELIKKCNIRYIGENYTKLALNELNQPDAYNNYISSELDVLNEQEEEIDDIKYNFRKWLISLGKYKPQTIKNYVYYVGYVTKKGYSNIDFYLNPEIKEIELLIDKLKSDESYKEFNKKNDYNPSSALIAYKEFLLEKHERLGQNYYVASIKDYSTVHKPYFDKYGYMYWREVQSKKYNIGDTIYLYFSEDNGQEITQIKKKAIVEEINVPIQRLFDETYYDEGVVDSNSEQYFIKVRLVSETDSDKMLLKNLKDKFTFTVPQTGTTLIENNELIDYIEIAFENDVDDIDREKGGENIIYYGGPGCGKSYKVNSRYCAEKNCFVRTTFFPDYTNSDFVGQLIPKIDKENPNRIKYEVQPGPFTLALEKALLNKKKHIYLIIEEINRGNASAIFGDIFQLLDRVSEDKDNKLIGMSEYAINNYIIEEYLKDIIKNKGIYIPSNLSIIATMNTSDQNVYTLDTAFKRRWKMEYVSNKFDEELDKEIFNKLIPVPGKTEYTWREFVDTINNAIVDKNKFGMNSEDKQIGKYFVGTHDLYDNVEEYNNKEEAIKTFAEKILMYLWEDVAKLNRNEWFDDEYKTLEALINGYKEKGLDVFKIDFKSSNEVEENE